ncbi:hypothetical protein SLS62_006854 [Diatrype stigma]|uniref:Peptidase M43 pregnancy-associated plasma-A domain-containing protein n=1 Tax=Diatrype stigma TaxID=117547 RepID=A0AAN9UML0_9PEZI
MVIGLYLLQVELYPVEGYLIGATLVGSSIATSLCGAGEPPADFISAVQSLRTAERAKSSPLHLRQSTTISIPVYAHAVVNSSVSDDYLSEEVLAAQVDVLVDRFAPHDITFTLENTTRTVDDELAAGLDTASFNTFKLTHRQGDAATLNLYYVTNMTTSTGGACTYPSTSLDPTNPLARLDGCVLQGYSVPGGTGYLNRTFLGEIAVHEVGHWLGLLHTFDGNTCDGNGDYVDDTPAQSKETEMYTCPVGQDSCPDVEGLDPIHNFMDYSGEGCWQEFTAGQKERMHNTFFSLRAPANSTSA